MNKKFAKSLSGHDKGHIYYILEETEKFVTLANGTTKLLAEPKKKNPKHLQIIKKLPNIVLIELGDGDTDLKIKNAIQTYEHIIKQEER